MQPTAEPVSRLIEEFNKLPGIGPKSAARLTYYLLRMPETQASALAEAILAVKQKTTTCSVCQNIADSDPCPVCASDSRDSTVICVVEEPLDILSIERIGSYHGKYHVLQGVINPIEGIGPDDLKIRPLLERVQRGGVREVILATDPTMEGDATAQYLHPRLKVLGVHVTRLARGLPVGGDLEYADQNTLLRALIGRQEMG